MRMRVSQLQDGTNEVDIKLLPDGRACIHWLRECETGPIIVQGHPKLREAMGRPPEGRYEIACNPKQNTISSQKRGSVRFMCMTSGELDAVTCPACLESVAAKAVVPLDNSKAAQVAMDTIKSIGV